MVSFWNHLSSYLKADINSGWLAPIAIWNAPQGFGEDVWIREVDETIFALHLKGAPIRRCFGREGVSTPGHDFALHPIGTPNHYSCTGPVTFAQIHLPTPLLDRVAASWNLAPLTGRLVPLSFISAPRLRAAVQHYVARGTDPREPASVLEMEALALLVGDALVRLHEPGAAQPTTRGGLAPWQERRVIEHLRAHLADEVALAELADLAGLSIFHFARAFKTSTGLPPHAYLRTLRAKRARELLESGDMSIVEIALETGYESSQALARAFRREVGMSPTEYRRERRR